MSEVALEAKELVRSGGEGSWSRGGVRSASGGVTRRCRAIRSRGGHHQDWLGRETEGEKLELGSGTSCIYGLWWLGPNIHMVVNFTG